MSDEFEVGHELDRALRAAVTGLAQIMERAARASADRSRAAAAEARQDWLTHRDAARQQYVPWLQPDTIEQADGQTASKVWAVAASWSTMDPMAKAAEEQLAGRIKQTYGEHPSILLQQTDLSTLPPQPDATKLLTMPEALSLARENAPFYYRHRLDEFDGEPASDIPSTPAEERLHEDWQYYSEHGDLPERSRWEAWANHAGRGEEFAPDQWRTPDGEVDHESRDAALQQTWDEGAEERGLRELEDHQVTMTAAGMGDLRDQVAPAPPAEKPSWLPLMEEQGFDAATPEEVMKGWRDARSRGVAGDMAAQAAAAQIADQIRKKHGVNPDDYLIGAMTERAANNAESRRKAEDKARRAQEEARTAPTPASSPAPAPAPAPSPPAAAVPQPSAAGAGVTADGVSRERVMELNRQAQDYFSSNLRPGSRGHKYFVERLGEGVTDGPWALGYAPSGWTNLTRHLQRNGATDAEILASGLGRMSSRGNVIDAFRDRAMVGVRDQAGEVVGFVGRDLSGDERAPKYVNTGGTPAFTKSEHVFGLAEAPQGAKIVRAEGAFDAMAISLAGDGEVAGVAPMGTAMSDQQASQIAAKAHNGRVWLANDRDNAGMKATEEDFYALAQHGVQARSVSVPGDDPAAAWQQYPGLMRSAMSTLDDAPSAGEVVIDRYIDTNAEALAGRDVTARRGLEDVVGRVTETIDDPIEGRLLAETAERRRQDLVHRSDMARGDGVDLEIAEQKIDYAADHSSDPDRADRLNDAAAYVERRATSRDVAGDRLEEASERVGETATPPSKAYDRAAESDLENLPPAARESVVVSSHGHSASTRDAIASAANRDKGRAARPYRGKDAAQQGRKLRR